MIPPNNTSAASSCNAAGSILLPFIVFSGLLAVFLIICIPRLMPPESPVQKVSLISLHQKIKNSIIAQKLIDKLLPSSVVRGARPTECRAVGRGIWYANGSVEINSSDPEQNRLIYWETLFEPASGTPLYLKIGDWTEGDSTEALRQAGIK